MRNGKGEIKQESWHQGLRDVLRYVVEGGTGLAKDPSVSSG